jgi:YD repeat-containing protein
MNYSMCTVKQSVVEDPNGPNYTTTYCYDVTDNLTGVNQSGQTRTFTYDSLKRLRFATNPESLSTHTVHLRFQRQLDDENRRAERADDLWHLRCPESAAFEKLQ